VKKLPRTKIVRREKPKTEYEKILEIYQGLRMQEPRVSTGFDVEKTVTNEKEQIAVTAWALRNIPYIYDKAIVKKALAFLEEKARRESEIRKQRQKEAEKRRKALQDPLNLFIRALKDRQVYPEELEKWVKETPLETKKKVFQEFHVLMKKQGLPLRSQDIDFGLNWLSAKIQQQQQADGKRSLIDKIKRIIT